MMEPFDFRRELEIILNKCSMENASNTPDFILGEYLMNCLNAFNKATRGRDAFYDPNKSLTEGK